MAIRQTLTQLFDDLENLIMTGRQNRASHVREMFANTFETFHAWIERKADNDIFMQFQDSSIYEIQESKQRLDSLGHTIEAVSQEVSTVVADVNDLQNRITADASDQKALKIFIHSNFQGF